MAENEELAQDGRNAAGCEDGFGSRLRERRRARGLSLVAVADELKIRRCYLRALEEEDVEELPARPFAIGFLRSYARLLDLDGDALVGELKAHFDGAGRAPAGEVHQEAALVADEGGDGSQQANGGIGKDGQPTLFGMAAFVIAALGIGAMVAAAGDGEIVSSVPAFVAADSSRPSPGASLMPARAPGTSHVTSGEDRVATSGASTGPAAGGAAARRAPGPQASATPSPTTRRARHMRDGPSLRPRLASAVHPTPAPAALAPVLFRARHDAWAMVEDDRGRPLWSGIIPAGSVWVPPGAARRFTTTHPANLELVVEGREWGILATGAVPVQDLPLDPAALRAHLKARAAHRRVTLSSAADLPS